MLFLILNETINRYLKLLSDENSAELIYYKDKNIISKFFYNLFKHPRNKSKELLYLDSIDDDEFYQLFCAYIIGSDVLTIPDCLNHDIKKIGGIGAFFIESVEVLKTRLPIKHEAAIHFKDKDCNFVIESLTAFQHQFLYTGSFLERKLLIIELLRTDININKIHVDVGISPFILSKLKMDNNRLDYIDCTTLEKLYEYAKAHLNK